MPLRGRLLARQHRPPLLLGDRRTLLDPHYFAHLELVLLVMGVIVLAPAHGLLQHGMREAPLDADHHGLVVLVAHHDSLQHAFRHRLRPNSSPLPSSSVWPSPWPRSWSPWARPWQQLSALLPWASPPSRPLVPAPAWRASRPEATVAQSSGSGRCRA